MRWLIPVGSLWDKVSLHENQVCEKEVDAELLYRYNPLVFLNSIKCEEGSGNMMDNVNKLLKEKLTAENYSKLIALDNPKLHDFVADAIELCQPALVFVCGDSPEDITYIRELAIKNGEERPLDLPGHTCHFDGYYDQARDKAQTKYLLPPGSELGASLNSIEKKPASKKSVPS